jgi:NADH:ubiquinone oxidoreductase subunit K
MGVFNHLLLVLLSLEFMVVIVFYLFIDFLGDNNYFYSLIYLIIAVCEGALGLSILIIIGRRYGGGYFNNLNLIY